MALWTPFENQYDRNATAAALWYISHEPQLLRGTETHWEFINYGFIRAGIEIRDPQYHNNERVINWQLLKTVCKAMFRTLTVQELKYIENLIRTHQQKDGLIPDFVTPESRTTPSTQYHNFSACLLGELVELGLGDFFHAAFIKAIEYIESHPRKQYGNINSLGRGNNQIKGFATGIYALVRAQRFDLAKAAYAYLRQFARQDEPYPLVLDHKEPHYSRITSPAPGWESYNNYFDYIPLAGYYFLRAAACLKP